MSDYTLRVALSKDSMALEFLDHPDRFEPTEHALVMMYDAAYSMPGDWLCVTIDVRLAMAKERIRCGHISHHRIEIEWAYSSTADRECPVLMNVANCRISDGRGGTEVREVCDGGIAFNTSSFIKRKSS